MVEEKKSEEMTLRYNGEIKKVNPNDTKSAELYSDLVNAEKEYDETNKFLIELGAIKKFLISKLIKSIDSFKEVK